MAESYPQEYQIRQHALSTLYLKKHINHLIEFATVEMSQFSTTGCHF